MYAIAYISLRILKTLDESEFNARKLRMGSSISFLNIENTTKEKKCKCGSWIAHYRKALNSDQKFFACSSCSAKQCRLGAHVLYEGKWFITPLCEKCNHHTNKDLMRLRTNRLAFLKNPGDSKYICQIEKDSSKWTHVNKSCTIL
jgi:hypothetical protein